MPSTEIVSIGSELLLGQIVDTNSAWLAQRLSHLGMDVLYQTSVADHRDRMKEVINRALDRSDIVITGGGLGPTMDDITREVVADVMGRNLVLDPDLMAQIERRFRRRGFILTENNERQARIPSGAVAVHNPNGTAPSFIVEDPRGTIFALPGVPFELKWLFDNEVAPYLRGRFGLTEAVAWRVLKVADMGESLVDNLIGHLVSDSGNPIVGILAHPGQVDVRITTRAASAEEASRLIADIEAEIRGLLGDNVFAADDETMESAVCGLLREQGLTIAVYEGLTGGLVAGRIQRAGPECFLEGVIGDRPETAHRLLKASCRSNATGPLPRDPAVLADGLAMGIRAQAGADLGLAVHAVPESSDTAENLARGRTYISVTDGQRFRRRSYNFAGRGLPDRTRLGLNALELLRRALLEVMT